jgi:GntR family transcriptional regulator
MTIDRSNPTPLYFQLERELLSKIDSGEWTAGQLIPTESEICDKYDLSRTTVRQALANLVRRGIIVRRAGKGTYVRERRIMSDPRGILQGGMERAGLAPRRKVLTFESIPSLPGVADELELPDGAEILKVVRLLLGNQTPIALTEILMHGALVPQLVKENFEEMNTYDVLARFGIHLAWGSVTVEARLASDEEAAVLEMPPGSPVLTTRRVTHLPDGRPFEIVRWIGRADMVIFNARFDSLEDLRTDLAEPQSLKAATIADLD